MDTPGKYLLVFMIAFIACMTNGQYRPTPYVQCGGLLTSPYGIIKSPGYPNNYPPNVNCTWTIVGTIGQVIELRFYRIDIEGSNGSCSDSIRVYDGLMAGSPLLVILCGAKNQSEISNLKLRSTRNYLDVYFSSDIDSERQGFIASYTSYTLQGCDPWTYGYDCSLTCPCVRANTASCNNQTGYCVCLNGWTGSDCSQRVDPCLANPCPQTLTCLSQGSSYSCLAGVYSTCNATITSTNGYIASPNYPNNYLNDIYCTLTIYATTNKLISLSFLDFVLEENSKCAFDYLNVFDGASNGKLIGKYCGITVESFIQSTTNSMRLIFKTDSSVVKKGFIASFTAHTCNNFTYGPGCAKTCNCIQSNTDSCDRLTGVCFCKTAWTGATCADDVDECLVQNSSSVCPVNSQCVNTVGSYVCNCRPGYNRTVSGQCQAQQCDKILTNNNGVIMSPNYPLNYDNDICCTWTIRSNKTDTFITVNINSYAVEGCPYDVLSIYDGNNANASMLGTYCSSAPGVVSSTGPVMHLVFVTDGSITRQGFYGTYSVQYTCRIKNCSHSCQVVSTNPRVEECVCPEWTRMDPNNSSRCIEINACNSTITAPSGYIVSPGYPNQYANNLNCYWIIAATPGKHITLGFSDVNIEQSNFCTYDYINVHDGRNASSTSIELLCGSTGPVDLRSSAQYMYIQFKTDSSVSGTGFKAQFNTI